MLVAILLYLVLWSFFLAVLLLFFSIIIGISMHIVSKRAVGRMVRICSWTYMGVISYGLTSVAATIAGFKNPYFEMDFAADVALKGILISLIGIILFVISTVGNVARRERKKK